MVQIWQPIWPQDRAEFQSAWVLTDSYFPLAAHTGATADLVAQAREQLRERLSLVHVQWLNQTHSTKTVDIAQFQDLIPEADAVTTVMADLACAVLTADCVPVLLRDVHSGRVAAVHAGWRGLVAGVLDGVLRCFDNLAHVEASIGPCISQDHFEVGSEVARVFLTEHPLQVRKSLVQNKWYVDLRGVVTEKLLGAGLTPFAIAQSPLCTYAHADLPSHRQDGTPRRMASLIWRKSFSS